ncbi:hypothetical protein Tco_0839953 [Tanacetum coccineum]|uniref:Retroviral polymerase SH3-like domain-containing protein n=1 Tax=Tanacetum coccineum TaxID=301880 RepID=A0ABQ5AWN1_9ASTR
MPAYLPCPSAMAIPILALLPHGILEQDTPCLFQRRKAIAIKYFHLPRTPEQNGVVEKDETYSEQITIFILIMKRRHITSSNDRKPSIKTSSHLWFALATLTRDGENLDKMKEKGDPCVMVGYSTQSKGYRVYNKRTRLIVESIHIKFDEIKEMMSDHNSSDLAPQRQEMSCCKCLFQAAFFTRTRGVRILTTLTPCPHRQKCFLLQQKSQIRPTEVEFLFSPLLEEYYTPYTPEELHTVRQTISLGKLIEQTIGKMIIKLKWLWLKNKKDEVGFSLPFYTRAHQVFSNLSDGRWENGFLNGSTEGDVYVAQPEVSLIRSSRKKSPSEESSVMD